MFRFKSVCVCSKSLIRYVTYSGFGAAMKFLWPADSASLKTYVMLHLDYLYINRKSVQFLYRVPLTELRIGNLISRAY
jgi:hypothetical protein